MLTLWQLMGPTFSGGNSFVYWNLKCDLEAHFLHQPFGQFHFRRYTLVSGGGTRGCQGKYSINLEKAHNHSVRKTSILRHVYNCFYMARVRSPYFRNDKFWEPRVAFQALIWENSECLEQHLLGLGSYKWCFGEIYVAHDKDISSTPNEWTSCEISAQSFFEQLTDSVKQQHSPYGVSYLLLKRWRGDNLELKGN